jgi:hypothetical protein
MMPAAIVSMPVPVPIKIRDSKVPHAIIIYQKTFKK